jgi:hypothetical protein
MNNPMNCEAKEESKTTIEMKIEARVDKYQVFEN